MQENRKASDFHVVDDRHLVVLEMAALPEAGALCWESVG